MFVILFSSWYWSIFLQQDHKPSYCLKEVEDIDAQRNVKGYWAKFLPFLIFNVVKNYDYFGLTTFTIVIDSLSFDEPFIIFHYIDMSFKSIDIDSIWILFIFHKLQIYYQKKLYLVCVRYWWLCIIFTHHSLSLSL